MNPSITFSYKLEEENEVIRSYLADLRTNFSENLTAFIMGTRSLDTWDAYIADLEKMNLDKVLEVYQAISDRQAASK
jgi:putative aldouronate transport system substrate-binding protein